MPEPIWSQSLSRQHKQHRTFPNVIYIAPAFPTVSALYAASSADVRARAFLPFLVQHSNSAQDAEGWGCHHPRTRLAFVYLSHLLWGNICLLSPHCQPPLFTSLFRKALTLDAPYFQLGSWSSSRGAAHQGKTRGPSCKDPRSGSSSVFSTKVTRHAERSFPSL